MLTDTHAHLDYPEFQEDFAGVLARAESAGVRRLLTIGTSIEGSRRAVRLAESHPMIWAVVGIHPTDIDDISPNFPDELREIARSPRVVAIGETGLDYHRLPGAAMRGKPEQVAEALLADIPEDAEASIADGAVKAAQAEIFGAQLDLAA